MVGISHHWWLVGVGVVDVDVVDVGVVDVDVVDVGGGSGCGCG